MNRLLQHHYQDFKEWWRTPATMKERCISSLAGGTGALWIGVLGRLVLDHNPVSISTLVGWAIGSVIIGMVAGFCFPKAVGTVMYPLSMLGVTTH